MYEGLEAGEARESIEERLRNEYLVSDEKIATSFTVATRERDILTGMNYRDGYSIYIGIPFCPTTCHYCSFTSYPLAKYGGLTDAYLTALTKELQYLGGCLPQKKLQTVYIGGGTPTALSAEQLERLLQTVRDTLPMEHCIEYTVEAGRPDSITARKLQVLKEYGVTRISINPQTMQQRTLGLIGRWHTVAQIVEAMHMAREAGHDNINMDIIIGLTGEGPEDVADTLSQIAELSPDSLTVHTLARKRAARLTTQKELYEGLEAHGVKEMLAESIAAYLGLNGLRARVVNLEMESTPKVSFLHLVRDVATLTRDELSLVADILYDAFPQTLLLDERDPLDPNFEVEQENLLDHMLGTMRQQRLHEKLLGIREGDRVVVYNQ